MSDDLETLLSPVDGGTMPCRGELLVASTRILRRRFLVRRIGGALGVAAIFFAGATAGWFLNPQPAERKVVELVYVDRPAAPAVKEAPRVEPAPLSPNDLELQAELSDDKAKVARLYREAGDKYLTEIHDYGQAARCYRLHLKAADAAEQQVSANDSWLLMSMKSTSHRE
jgi:hypothetical protein